MKKGVSKTRESILKVIKDDFYNNYFFPKDIVRSMRQRGLEEGMEKNISVCVNILFNVLLKSGILKKEEMPFKKKYKYEGGKKQGTKRHKYSIGKNFDSYFYFYFNIKPRLLEEKLKLLKEFPLYYARE